MYLSFCGCGFLGVYHLGAVKALVSKGNTLLRRVDKYSGASAGALVACLLSVRGTDVKLLQECTEFCYDSAFLARQQQLGVLSPNFSLLDLVEEFMTKVLPEDAYLTANGRLYVSVTDQKKRKNSLVSQFQSNQYLIECLLASCYIPYITGYGRKRVYIEGHKYIDGGLTDNLPFIPGEEAVSISPFCGGQDISPEDKPGMQLFASMSNQKFQVNRINVKRGYHALFPPSQLVIEAYHEQGYQDALRFLNKAGYLP